MDSTIKVIIAEDTVEAQETMVSFLKPLKNFEMIGIVDNRESLLEINLNTKPNLIITDIHMLKLDGIETIESCLKVNPELKVIFTTAHDQYAVKAFDLNVADYVLKPIKKERLYLALEKVRILLGNDRKVEQKPILMIQMDRASFFIKHSDIIYVEKENRKTVIHTIEQRFETNESLDSILTKLPANFFRTHRSFIVNLESISHITVEGETYIAHFRNYPHYAHISKLRINELHKELSNE